MRIANNPERHPRHDPKQFRCGLPGRDCSQCANERTPRRFPCEGFDKSGEDLLSRCSHYHWPQVLNGRVRNGNGCGHLGMVTGKTHEGDGSGRMNHPHCVRHPPRISKGSGKLKRLCKSHRSVDSEKRSLRIGISRSRLTLRGIRKADSVEFGFQGTISRHSSLSTRHCLFACVRKRSMRSSGRLLVPVGSEHRCSYTSGLSTWSSSRSLCHKWRETSSCGGFHALMPSAFILAERWLPSDAPSGTTGTPEVRPSQSSRTREKTAQVSYARTR